MGLSIKLTHLEQALTYSSGNGKANCFQRSAALMLDLKRGELVFGIVRAARPDELLKMPNASTEPFIHAWVEFDGDVYAPTLWERSGNQLRPVPKGVYYETNGVTRTWRLTHAQFDPIARRFRLSAAFKHRKSRAGHGDVTDALLAAAGVRYTLTEHRTVIPLD